MDPDTDRRIGSIEVKQQARDARCRACLDRLRREVALARSVRLWAAVATVLAVVLAVAVLFLLAMKFGVIKLDAGAGEIKSRPVVVERKQ